MPRAIQKGSSLAQLLDQQAIECLAANIQFVHQEFEHASFILKAMAGVEGLPLMQRAKHIAHVLKHHLPDKYSEALSVLLSSLTPAMQQAEEFGLAGFFYLPHGFFISEFGQDAKHNDCRSFKTIGKASFLDY